MLNCEQVTELCSKEMERELRLREQVSLGVHLMMCGGCGAFRDQIRALRSLMRTYADGGAASAGNDGASGEP